MSADPASAYRLGRADMLAFVLQLLSMGIDAQKLTQILQSMQANMAPTAPKESTNVPR